MTDATQSITSLKVTFRKKQESFLLELDGDKEAFRVHVSRTSKTTQEDLYYHFLVEDYYCWIRYDPMSNPGGLYGICFYLNEAKDAPSWVREFANCFA